MELLNEEIESAVPERTNEELDKLADSSDHATNRDRAMTKEPEKATPQKTEEGFEFVHNGKPIKASREQILKWAQMGYDRPQFAQKINQEKAKWEAQKAEWEKSWGVYKQIDEYAKGNQDWWNHVVQSWQTKGAIPQAGQPGMPQQTPGNDPYAPKFQALEQKLSQIEPVLSQFQKAQAEAKAREEDQKLEQEIQSIRAKHADLDWDTLDENGKSLELRILEHAQQNGIPKFTMAMRDLLHDELVAKAQSQAKLSIAKGIQAKTKLGVLGESPTPTKGMPAKNRDMRKTSYEELEADIREEIQRGQYK